MADERGTIIGVGTELKGIMDAKEPVRVKGKLEGEIRVEAELFIDKEARLEADVFARDVYLEGEVKGNIEAFNKLEINNTGRLQGDIKTPNLSIARGAVFSGRSEMKKSNIPPLAKEKTSRS